jgi:hypothetical protein
MGLIAAMLVVSGLWDPRPVVILVALLLPATAFLMSSLTVTVHDEELRVAFGPGLIRRRIPLRRIRRVSVVTTPWYYGWGIRWTPRGWLWNVSGLRGVELELDNGRRFRIGSDEPERLANALRRATETRP